MQEVHFLIELSPTENDSAAVPALFMGALARGASVTFKAPDASNLAVAFSDSSPFSATNAFVVPAGSEQVEHVRTDAASQHYPFQLSAPPSFSSTLQLAVGPEGEDRVGFELAESFTGGFDVRLVRTVTLGATEELSVTVQNETGFHVDLLLNRGHLEDVPILVAAGHYSEPISWIPGQSGLVATLAIIPSQVKGGHFQTGGTRLADIIVEPP